MKVCYYNYIKRFFLYLIFLAGMQNLLATELPRIVINSVSQNINSASQKLEEEVTINYSITGDIENTDFSIYFYGYDNTNKKNIEIKTFLETELPLSSGPNSVLWRIGEDWDGQFSEDVLIFGVVSYNSPYIKIDISTGANAESYSTSILNNVPSEGWSEYDKSNYLILARIDGGTFTMGSPDGEKGRYSDEDNILGEQSEITISKPFYIGIFEITNAQWDFITGDTSQNPTFPKTLIKWNDMRGGNWPYPDTPDSSTFIGELKTKTNLQIDLPTEAQWEYSCRATTIRGYSDYTKNDGEGSDCKVLDGSQDTNLDDLGWYSYNSNNSTHEVGLKNPNLWGLYDMHGNVSEMCLDWYRNYIVSSPSTDPEGFPQGSSTARVIKGGSFYDYARWCRSATRLSQNSDSYTRYLGARVSMSSEVISDAYVVTLDTTMHKLSYTDYDSTIKILGWYETDEVVNWIVASPVASGQDGKRFAATLTSGQITMTQDEILPFSWNTEWYIDFETGTGGEVQNENGWFAENETYQIIANASPGYLFSEWQGVSDDVKNNNPLEYSPSTSETITALFVEDNIAPEVQIMVAVTQTTPAYQDPVIFNIAFSEEVHNFSLDNILITGITGVQKSLNLLEDGKTYELVISQIGDNATINIELDINGIVDYAGNQLLEPTYIDNTLSYIRDWQSSIKISVNNEDFTHYFGMNIDYVNMSTDSMAEDNSYFTLSDSSKLQYDYREAANDGKWILEWNFDTQDKILLSWDGIELSDNLFFRAFLIDNDKPVDLDKYYWNLNEAGTASVPSSGKMQILYSHSFPLKLMKGWNLISLPGTPENSNVDTIFSPENALVFGWNDDESFIDIKGRWAWDGSSYVSTSTISALTGYWLFVERPAIINIPLEIEASSPLFLSEWNLVGPSSKTLLPEAEFPQGDIWGWAYGLKKYFIVNDNNYLIPGSGYWVRLPENN